MSRSARELRVEILSVGNELLDGRTLNTNAQWLGQRITALGGTVSRIMVIGDDLQEIRDAVREAGRRQPNWLIITGGLGPTHDDKTLEGVAIAARQPLGLNTAAVAMLRQHYARLVAQGVMREAQLTEARLKMACLPGAAMPLPNPTGAAPGALLQLRGTWIACLPGVPKEMEAIYEGALEPRLRKTPGRRARAQQSFLVTGTLESVVAPLIDEVMRATPGVFIKSHPRGVEDGISHLEFDIMASHSSMERARVAVRAATRKLAAAIRKAGGQVRRPRAVKRP
jgi:molybdenum cofactor synthesis domain-containing protein